MLFSRDALCVLGEWYGQCTFQAETDDILNVYLVNYITWRSNQRGVICVFLLENVQRVLEIREVEFD